MHRRNTILKYKDYEKVSAITGDSSHCICEMINRKKVLTVEQLPEAAQMYIEENMPDAKVIYVKKEQKNFQTRYEVKFDNQIEYEFDSDGEIIDIDVDD